MKITIHGNTPSKKNSRRPFVRNGRMMNFPSQRYVDWHRDALTELKLTCNVVDPIERINDITLTFYAPNKRKYDLTNRAESIMDLLVDGGILSDDNWEVVPKVTLIHGGVEKEDPRCEIVINR